MIKRVIGFFLLLALITLGGITYLTVHKVFNTRQEYTNPLYKTTIYQMEFSYPPQETSRKNAIVKKEKGRWLVKEKGKGFFYPAQTSLVSNLVQRLTSVPTLEIISTNKNFLSRFDLDKDSRAVVKVYSRESKKATVIYVGKMAADFQNTYLSFSPQGPVLLFPADRFLILPAELVLENPLQDKLTDLQEIKSLEINKSKQKVQIDHQLKEDKWLLSPSGKKEIKASKVEEWFDKLKGFQTKEILPTAKEKLSQVAAIKIELKDKKELAIYIYKRGKERGFWLSTTDWPEFAWQVDKSLVNQLLSLGAN